MAGSSNNVPSLTTTEARVIAFLIAGKKQEEISRLILVSKRRVEEIISDMKEKYSCATLVQLTHFLIQNGLI